MEEEDPEEDSKEEPLEEEDTKEKYLVEEDLKENSVEEEPNPEVTYQKRGRCGKMCQGTCPIDAPEQQMLEIAERQGLLFLMIVLFLSFFLLLSTNLENFAKVLM